MKKLLLSFVLLTASMMCFAQIDSELLKKAKRGDASAQYSVGACYRDGDGVQQDYAEAFKWFEKAAKKGHGSALNEVGFAYEFGKGVEKNYEKAYLAYTKGITTTDNASCRANLGYMFEKGYYVKQDYSNAIKWYKEAAEMGDDFSMCRLGIIYSTYYSNGQGSVDKNDDTAFGWFLKAGEKGNKFSILPLAWSYRDGKGTTKNYEKAIEWFRKSLPNGKTGEEENQIGVLYVWGGYGIAQDYPQAATWFRLAADKGFNISLSNLGYMYMRGYGVEQDTKKAMDLFNTVISKGDKKAIPAVYANMGEMYYNGYGVDKDYTKAFEYLKKAAEDEKKPQKKAMRLLSACYRYGLGTAIDNEKAEYWLKEAANHKDEKAMAIMSDE